MLTQNEKIVTTLIITTCLILLFAVILIIAILKYRRKQQQYIEREQTIKTELIKAILEAKEQVLEDISDQIHIDIQQTLSLTKISINKLILSSDKKYQKQIKPVKELLDRALSEVKSLSRSFDPKLITGHTLEDNITRLLNQVIKKTSLKTNFNTSQNEIQVTEQKQIFIYRIVQEAINNILNHAEATEIIINLKNDHNTFSLSIEDNGKGFDKNKNNNGLGLTSIRRRIYLMAGELFIESFPNQGTKIFIIIPYDK